MNFLKSIFFIEICYFYSYIASISFRVYLKFMTVQINYKGILSKQNSSNLVLFVEEKHNISSIKKYITSSEYAFILDLLKSKDLKREILEFDVSSKKKIILVSLKKNLNSSAAENLGAKFYDLFKDSKKNDYIVQSTTIPIKLKNFVGHFLHGLKLKSYSFDKYKTKKNTNNISLTVLGKNNPTHKDQLKFKAIEQGTFYTRDLVSEPGNVLHPDEYAKRLNSLKKDGLKVSIFDQKKLKKMGMNT